MFNWWPFTNLHDLNMDWIICKLKEWSDEMDAAKVRFDSLETAIASIEKYLSSGGIPNAVSKKLDDMLAAGELNDLLANKVEFADTLYTERHGSFFRDATAVPCPGMQGFCMVDSQTALVYFAGDLDGYENPGSLELFNVVTGETLRTVSVSALHGQAVAYSASRNKVFILNYYQGSFDPATTVQRITTLDFDTFDNVDHFEIIQTSSEALNNPVIACSAMCYDANADMLLIGGTSADSPGGYGDWHLKLASFDKTTMTCELTPQYVYNKPDNVGIVACDRNSQYTVMVSGNSTTVMIAPLEGGNIIRYIPVAPQTSDHFILREVEGIAVDNYGNIILSFLSVLSRQSPHVRSGAYIGTFAHGNMYTNIVQRTALNTDIAHFYARYIDVDNTITYYNANGTNHPVSSIAIACGFDINGTVIRVLSGHSETLQALNFQYVNGVRLSNLSANFNIGELAFYDSYDVTVIGMAGHIKTQLYCNACTGLHFTDQLDCPVVVRNSVIYAQRIGTGTNTVDSDTTSSVYTYYAGTPTNVTGAFPLGTKWYLSQNFSTGQTSKTITYSNTNSIAPCSLAVTISAGGNNYEAFCVSTLQDRFFTMRGGQVKISFNTGSVTISDVDGTLVSDCTAWGFSTI